MIAFEARCMAPCRGGKKKDTVKFMLRKIAGVRFYTVFLSLFIFQVSEEYVSRYPEMSFFFLPQPSADISGPNQKDDTLEIEIMRKT